MTLQLAQEVDVSRGDMLVAEIVIVMPGSSIGAAKLFSWVRSMATKSARYLLGTMR